ncbi:MAG: tRNA 2-thiocytidine(32) synthetase TtcA [Deltaproteobacteria bacterium]|nr:tRNA 2-thiocytidine(32) synthetase TtcA [Deltaproteobacteria bacterium]MBW1979052.1 tRNA 2-thiocytidine(32) synthetase TtcA [Deltaproteobacteria bacterium]MBW2045772.1 tRNA 2-thiocytidine(32) synthetase TtcA [Deltaproteobacteria bacterium]MBW2300915.1 tRNA 2-thiocytidine(32) synthetase TtcA [Deltaproteobacteria bacterium]RLB34339.1 MAG: tRNA 2-thiocytidine(32) synthetase TtcA [Deltaproteobacteria bacterium]
MSFAAKEIRRLMGKAIHTREMISEGDHVLVAVSGGKDSLSLLWLLRERLKRVPIEYGIIAVHVDVGFGSDSAERMKSFFTEHGFDYRIVRTDIGPKAHGPENRENPCFLCSRLRRKILFELANELGCNKIAFGHHKDDVIETFFLNLFYGASLSTMMPVQDFFQGKLTIIRPMYLIDLALVKRYANSMGWPEIDLGCPSAGSTKREEIRKMLRSFYRGNKKVKGNIFHALHNVRPEYLL